MSAAQPGVAGVDEAPGPPLEVVAVVVEPDVEPELSRTNAPGPEPLRAAAIVEEQAAPDVVAEHERVAVAAETMVEADAVDRAGAVDVELAADESKIEPEPILVDQVISEEPAPDLPEAAVGPRRFKSALLSDIDDPSTLDANAKFKSSILADLSAVRLPDDGPRFRSTTLIDLAKPDEHNGDSTQSNGARNRRD